MSYDEQLADIRKTLDAIHLNYQYLVNSFDNLLHIVCKMKEGNKDE